MNFVKTGFDFKIIKKAMENGISAYGIIMYESIIFMALNNGTVSAILSFLKTMVFEVASVIILPMILGKNEIWLSVSLAELMAFMLTAFFMVKNRKKYNYI